ncbi:polymer-forming cytoskeletal protein [Candidatus Margulisiibacteriota bacterium]
MFGNNKKVYHFEEGAVDTVIGEQAKVEGVLHSQGSLRIEGVVIGEIHAQGEVFIGEKSKVEASIFGRRVTVAGEVKGTIEAVNGLEIVATGKVYGDIIGDRLIVEEGAVYRGNVNMDVISPKKLADHQPPQQTASYQTVSGRNLADGEIDIPVNAVNV